MDPRDQLRPWHVVALVLLGLIAMWAFVSITSPVAP